MAPLLHVLENLRPADQEEMDAIHGEGWAVPVIADIVFRLATKNCGWLFWHEGEPVAALGAYAMTPTCAGCWAFGTPAWPKVVLGVTRHVRRTMIPLLLRVGFHRAECRALFKRSDTKRWLTSLGWEPEAVLSEFGARREDFLLFAWCAHEQTHHPPGPERRSPLSLRNGG